jgi:rod shape-determining protein MreC
MEHTPPPFFKTGPTPLARLLIFSVLSLVLLITDARFKYLNVLREVAAIIVYPLQRIAAAPASIGQRIGDFFSAHSSLREENEKLRRDNMAQTLHAQQYKALQTENAHLRGLLGARERVETIAMPAEVLYAARDPFTRKIMLDRGSRHDVQSGQPVIDAKGVVGQVTRVYPFLSEVTLVTDKGHLVPVLNVRNGLRSVLAGTGRDGTLELQFAPLNADFQNGDQLVTSGIDGVYPPGLPVAEVTQVDRASAHLFAKILCKPLAGVASHAQVMLVSAKRDLPPRPVEETEPKAKRDKKGRKGA